MYLVTVNMIIYPYKQGFRSMHLGIIILKNGGNKNKLFTDFVPIHGISHLIRIFHFH